MFPKGKSELKAIDFFCGAGGMTHGMSQVGINVLAGIDIASDCKETYETNNNSKFIEADINEYSPEKLAEDTGIIHNDDSLIFIGCSPCQYWTKIRTDKTKSRMTRNLLGRFKVFVDHFRPGYVVIENVPGLSRNKESNVLAEFKNFLSEIDYVFDDNVINANKYGVPQHRERYLLIATRLSKQITLPVQETDENLIVKNFIGEHNGFKRIPDNHKDESDFLHTSAGLSNKNRRRIFLTTPDGGTRYCWKDDPDLQIDAYKNKDHVFRDVYARMWWDKPAPTITTRFNSLSNGRFGHPEEHRAISLREGATLQTFPKEYIFKSSNQASIARQIGNAVPPELAKRIGLSIKADWINASI